MTYNPGNPLIVQGDKSVLLEVNNDLYGEARDQLGRFAELEKSPEYVHTYRITPLSLWNAASSGMGVEEVVAVLEDYGKFELPQNVRQDIRDQVSRYGRLKLIREGDDLILYSEDGYLVQEIINQKKVQPYILRRVGTHHLQVDPGMPPFPRELLKRHLPRAQIKYKVLDARAVEEGDYTPEEYWDLIQVEDCDEMGVRDFFKVEFMRLTPLGAYLLGVNADYEEPEGELEDSGFIVQPNFEVVVAPGGARESHQLFLEKFAEKVSLGKADVYRLTFKAMVNALDQGISIQELIDYLQAFSDHPVPENVLLTLQGWERDSKKVRIRTVTILEARDQFLLEELKSYKAIRNHCGEELNHAIEVKEKSATKLKREIEKKNHFCLLE